MLKVGIIPLNKDFGVNYFLPDRTIFGQLLFARPGNFLPDKLKSYGFLKNWKSIVFGGFHIVLASVVVSYAYRAETSIFKTRCNGKSPEFYPVIFWY